MKFEKEFVYFMWDKALEGEPVFIGDSIDGLVKAVEEEWSRHVTVDNESLAYPFRVRTSGGAPYRFVYFDPLFDIKKAYAEGQEIEVRDLISGQWIVPSKPVFLPERAGDYRIKGRDSGGRATFRELANWLAQGKGQYRFVDGNSDMVLQSFTYNERDDDKEVVKELRVRKWGDAKWREPTKAYLEVHDEQKEAV